MRCGRFFGLFVLIVLVTLSALAEERIDRTQPLYMQADQLIYDTRGNRVIAQGNVELYYNNHILTADQVTYDHSTKKLTAEGNAQLKDSSGHIRRADRFDSLEVWADAFAQSLATIGKGDKPFGLTPNK